MALKRTSLPHTRMCMFVCISRYTFFLNRVRDNLHIVLCFSPVGDKFSRRAQQFPGLINGCTIDWWVPPLLCVCVCVQAAVLWPRQRLHHRLVGPTFGVCMFVYVCVRVCVCVCEQQFPGLVNGCTIDWWVPPLVCVCVCKQQFPGLINGCTIDWWVPPLVCVCACVCVRLRAAVPGL